MVKGKSKGSDPLDELLAEKSYKNALEEVIKTTPVQKSDFDQKAFRLLDALNEKGRAEEACELLQNSLKGVQRKRIENWKRYLYSLLKKVDETAYKEMKESQEKEKEEHGTRRRSRKSEKPENSNSEAPASAPSKKEFNKGATEFVPGKPWKTPEVGKVAPEVASKSLRIDAAEFVPTVAARAAAEVPQATLPTPLFPVPQMPVPAALPFQDFGAAWTAQESKANGKTSNIAMKPDAQEFFPGVSAWAGAMVMPKQKAKAKAKASTARPRHPTSPGFIPSQPMSPGLQSTSRDADTAAGGSPSQPSPVGRVQEVEQAVPESKQEAVVPAISNSCSAAFVSKVSPKVVNVSKDCKEILGVLTETECTAILSTVESLGFSPAEQDRAGGSPRCLVSKDPWLAATLWQRLAGVTPCIINGKRILGLQEDLVVQHGARGSALENNTGNLAVQVCLKTSPQASAGDAYILSIEPDGPVASWLTALMQCQEGSWLTSVQDALGLGGPRPQRRRMMATMAVMATSVAAAMMFTGIRRRRLSQ